MIIKPSFVGYFAFKLYANNCNTLLLRIFLNASISFWICFDCAAFHCSKLLLSISLLLLLSLSLLLISLYNIFDVNFNATT